MSTSSLYHAWRLRGYRYQRTNLSGGGADFVIEQSPDRFRTRCGSPSTCCIPL